MEYTIEDISHEIGKLKYINPLNIKQEKEKFFKDESYNPVFKYTRFKKDTKKIYSKLKNRTNDNKIIEQLEKEQNIEMINKVKLLKHVGTKKFTEYSKKIYGKPSKKLYENAIRILKRKDKPEKRIITPQKVGNQLLKEAKKRGYDIKILLDSTIASRASIDSHKKILRISTNEKFSRMDIKKLLHHEILTHMKRYKNGCAQKYQIFKLGTKGYLETEEGLATYNEKINKCLTLDSLKMQALKVIAVHTGLRKSFRETYNELRKYAHEDKAFKMTLRAKRGLTDTSKKGGFTKDYIYLEGYNKILSMNKKDLKYLYAGKVSIKDIHKIKKLVSQRIIHIKK